jgi:hypothetical protein
MAIKVKESTQPRIKTTSKKERKIDPKEVAEKLGGEPKYETLEDREQREAAVLKDANKLDGIADASIVQGPSGERVFKLTFKAGTSKESVEDATEGLLAKLLRLKPEDMVVRDEDETIH